LGRFINKNQLKGKSPIAIFVENNGGKKEVVYKVLPERDFYKIVDVEYMPGENTQHVLVGIKEMKGSLTEKEEDALIRAVSTERDEEDICVVGNAGNTFILYLNQDGMAIYRTEEDPMKVKVFDDKRPKACEYFGLLMEGSLEQAKEMARESISYWKENTTERV